MSVTLMSAVWRTELPSTQKLVLLAIADNANDQGECFPSIPMLAQKCSLSDRAVQKAMGELATERFLRRDVRAGKSTVYIVTDPRTWFTTAPERRSPPNDVHPERRSPTPERRSPPPPNDVHHGGERGSPITITEPSVEPSPNQKKAVVVPDWLDPGVWAMWDKYRRSIGKGWTDDAQRLAIGMLAKHREAGWSPAEVVENAINSNWRGLYPPRGEPRGSQRKPTTRLSQQADVIRQLTTSNPEAIDG